MGLVEEFTVITEEYDNKLFNIFKRVIDVALKDSEDSKMNPIETFIHVNAELESSYVELALALGIITEERVTTYEKFSLNSAPISEKLLERIDAYMEPIVKEARKIIRQKAKEVQCATSLEELQEKYNHLMAILNNESILNFSYIFEDLEINDFAKRKLNI